MARDSEYWKRVVFPMLLSVIAGSLGIVELHAACVAQGDRGLILAGQSKSGKSTLAMAMTNAGFRLLTDDRTFCSLNQQKISAYGLPRPLKLRVEAALWFEEFRHQEPVDFQSGERVFFWDAGRPTGRQKCEPEALVFLERQQSPCFSLSLMTKSEVRHRIESDLLAEAPAETLKQEGTLLGLLSLPCWRLQYGGNPVAIANRICESLLDGRRFHRTEPIADRGMEHTSTRS